MSTEVYYLQIEFWVHIRQQVFILGICSYMVSLSISLKTNPAMLKCPTVQWLEKGVQNFIRHFLIWHLYGVPIQNPHTIWVKSINSKNLVTNSASTTCHIGAPIKAGMTVGVLENCGNITTINLVLSGINLKYCYFGMTSRTI